MIAAQDNGKAPEAPLTTSQSLVSFQSLYESLDLPTSPSSISPESVLRIALARIDQLKSPGEPFKKQSAASKKAVEAGKVKALNGEEIALEPGEKELVFKISSRFDLDECTAFLLLRSFLRSDEAASLSLPPATAPSSGPDASSSSSAAATIADDLLDHFNLFFFRERLALLKLISALLRAYEDETHDYFTVALELVPLLLSLPTASSLPTSSSPPFSESLFRQFITLARTPLPNTIASSERHASLWAKQSLKEQLALLEIVFLVLYSPMPADAGTAEGIIMASVASGFGREQANGRLVGSDEEGREMLRGIEGMLVLICVEVLSLESLLASPTNNALSNVFSPTLSQSIEPPTPIVLSSPTHLLSLHNFFSSPPPNSNTPAISPVLLAWSYVVSRLTDYLTEETPESYIPLADAILPSASSLDGPSSPPAWQTYVSAAVGSKGGLFEYLKGVMDGPLFVDVETKNGAMPADLNSLGYRSVFKGLVLCLNELVRVEFLPFQPLLDVWIALFGTGTGSSSLCTQFWQDDYPLSASRRSLISLARSRFPILFRPLVQILRSLTGSSSSHPTSSTFSPSEDLSPSDIDQSVTCAHIVFSFFSTLPTLPYVLPANTRGLFVAEQGIEEGEMQYRSLKRLAFPGGVVVPVGSVGTVVSPPRVSPVVVSWNVEVSGWKIALEVLRSFIGEKPKRRTAAKKGRIPSADVFGAGQGGSRAGEEEIRVKIEDLGMEDIGEEAVLDILHLFGSLLSSGPDLATHLIDHLSLTSLPDEIDPPSDLVQILFTILERSLASSRPNSKLVSLTLGVLTSLLPAYPGRVWTYLRSSSLLFSKGRRSASTAAVLASERSTGTYGMTIALLDLIFALFLEAQRTHFVVAPDFLTVKADVLSRALGLIHAEIWSGYTGWKYTSLRERFDIGRKTTTLYDEILKDPTLAPSSSPGVSLGPLSILQTFLAEAFILNTTSLTLSPIVSTLVIGRGLVSGLYASGRVFEAPKAERLIEVTLRLARHVLALKRRLNVTRIVALEQLFFDRSSTSRAAGSRQLKAEIVDVVANFVVSPTSSPGIASEAVCLLSTLCGSLSTATSDTPPSIVGHLDDAVATTRAFLAILGDPYQNRDLRRSVWNLLGVLVSTQIGWAALFIDLDHQGKLMSSHPSSSKGKEKETDKKDETNAIVLAHQMISIWSELWDSDPALLSSILRFIDLAWQHFPDHSSIATLRSDPTFWEKIFAIALRSKLTPSEIDLSDEASSSRPAASIADEDEAERDIRAISYRNLSRAHAIHLFALDLEMIDRRSSGGKNLKDRKVEQASFGIIEKMLLRQKHRLLGGATLRYLRNSCDPELHEEVHKSISDAYPGLSVERMRVTLPLEEREFGHDYLFSTDILRQKLEGFRSDAVDTLLIDGTIGAVESINLDWSLIDSESSCTKAWRQFLAAAVPLILESSPNLAEILLRDVRLIAPIIAAESRPGDVVLAVHGERMEILRCLVQGTWGSSVMDGAPLAKSTNVAAASSNPDSVPQIESFIGSLPSIQALITSETFSPLDSLLGGVSIPFHQTLLQILFLFVRKAVDIPPHSSGPSYVTAQQRYILHTFLQTTLKFLVTALSAMFERILQTRDPALDDQLGFLVSVFEQAIRIDHQLSPTEWLALADELGLFRLSLDLLTSASWSSPSSSEGDVSMSESVPRRPLFVENILNLHLAVSMLDRGAERLVGAGIMAAYSSNIVVAQAEMGAIASVLRESYGMGVDPTHACWLIMLSVVVNLIGSIGPSVQFVQTEIVPWVQLCGSQLTRSLAPNASQAMTSPRLHELSLISSLFLTIATCLSTSPTASRRPKSIPVLRAFADRAVFLVAWINDLLAHPNRLSSTIEPVSEEERWMLSKETGLDDSSQDNDGSDQPMVNEKKRPLLASCMQKLILLSRNILFALNLAANSSTILSTDPSIWPPENLIIMPDSKVSTTDPATLGTLLELGNLMTDWNRHLASSASGSAGTQKSKSSADKLTLLYLPEFSASTCISATRHSLEAISLLATTQLVLAASIKLSSLPAPPLEESTPLDQRSMRNSRRSMGGSSYDERENVLERFRELAQDTHRMLKVGSGKTEREEGEGEILGVLSEFLERELLS